MKSLMDLIHGTSFLKQFAHDSLLQSQQKLNSQVIKVNFIQCSAQRICSDEAPSLQLIGEGEVFPTLVALVHFLSSQSACVAVLTLVRFLPSVKLFEQRFVVTWLKLFLHSLQLCGFSAEWMCSVQRGWQIKQRFCHRSDTHRVSPHCGCVGV